LTASTLPVEVRGAFLQLSAAHMQIEGETTDAAFQRAHAFALRLRIHSRMYARRLSGSR